MIALSIVIYKINGVKHRLTPSFKTCGTIGFDSMNPACSAEILMGYFGQILGKL